MTDTTGTTTFGDLALDHHHAAPRPRSGSRTPAPCPSRPPAPKRQRDRRPGGRRHRHDRLDARLRRRQLDQQRQRRHQPRRPRHRHLLRQQRHDHRRRGHRLRPRRRQRRRHLPRRHHQRGREDRRDQRAHGGTVTLSGPITETGDADATQENGGIAVTGNSGGSTVVSNATKTFNTGEDHASSWARATATRSPLRRQPRHRHHQRPGSGRDHQRDACGLRHRQHDRHAGPLRALNVANTDIGAAGATFQRISSNGAAAADPANGIVLDDTGTGAG